MEREHQTVEGGMTREEILERVRAILVEMFELDPAAVTLDAHLQEELDLDSIDAIDMAVKLQEITGERVPDERLAEIRTVADVVDFLASRLGAS